MTFKVRKTACPTCIYSKDSPLDLDKLESDVQDRYGAYMGWRVCHYHEDVCCRGFWNRHQDEFTLGRMAKTLGCVEYTDDGPLNPLAEVVRELSP